MKENIFSAGNKYENNYQSNSVIASENKSELVPTNEQPNNNPTNN
jgi:hypothetical protein